MPDIQRLKSLAEAASLNPYDFRLAANHTEILELLSDCENQRDDIRKLRSELSGVMEFLGRMAEYVPSGFSAPTAVQGFAIEAARIIAGRALVVSALSSSNQRIAQPPPAIAGPHPLEISMGPGARSGSIQSTDTAKMVLDCPDCKVCFGSPVLPERCPMESSRNQCNGEESYEDRLIRMMRITPHQEATQAFSSVAGKALK